MIVTIVILELVECLWISEMMSNLNLILILLELEIFSQFIFKFSHLFIDSVFHSFVNYLLNCISQIEWYFIKIFNLFWDNNMFLWRIIFGLDMMLIDNMGIVIHNLMGCIVIFVLSTHCCKPWRVPFWFFSGLCIRHFTVCKLRLIRLSSSSVNCVLFCWSRNLRFHLCGDRLSWGYLRYLRCIRSNVPISCRILRLCTKWLS